VSVRLLSVSIWHCVGGYFLRCVAEQKKRKKKQQQQQQRGKAKEKFENPLLQKYTGYSPKYKQNMSMINESESF